MELKMSLESISLTFPVTSRKSKRPLKGSVGATKLGAMPKLRPAQPPEQHGETASSSARPASSLPFPTAPVPFFFRESATNEGFDPDTAPRSVDDIAVQLRREISAHALAPVFCKQPPMIGDVRLPSSHDKLIGVEI